MSHRFRTSRSASDARVDLGRPDPAEPEPPSDPAPALTPPASSTPAPPAFQPLEDQSLVDEHSTFNGKYHSSRNLVVEGTVEGEIVCDGRVTVAEQAMVQAKVTAQDLTVAGKIEGEISCRGLLEVLPTGQVQGTVNTSRLVIHDGAFCNGSLTMQTPDSGAGEDPDAPGDKSPSETPESPTAIFRSPVRKVE